MVYLRVLKSKMNTVTELLKKSRDSELIKETNLINM